MVEERWIIFSKDQIWLSESMRLPTGRELNPALVAEQNVRTLKDAAGVCFRGAFLPADSLPTQWRLLHLRQAFELLNDEEYKLACKLKELLHWDEVHQYCGHCAHPLANYTEISKRCPNCGREYWPSPSPAIIVLVEKPAKDGNRDNDEILMIHAHSFPGSFNSLVAGYVETGETLEETVSREVLEETGVQIRNVRYVASQSWPFPFVQMIGFRAEYAGGELLLQEEEIARGGWFRRDSLPELPGKISLARKMIDAWLQEG